MNIPHGFLLLLILTMACTFLVQCDRTKAPTSSNNSIIIRSVIATPPVIKLGASLSIVVDAIDPDGGTLRYEWDPGLGEIIGSGSKVQFTAPWCCLGARSSRRLLIY